jgi:hypothetical protein
MMARLEMSGRVPRDAKPRLWFDLAVELTPEARDADRVSALISVTARLSERGLTPAGATAERLLVPRAYLRLGLEHQFRLESIRQIRPTENDLTGHQLPQDGGAIDIPLLAWSEETRDYLVELRVDPAALSPGKVPAARVEMVGGLPNETPVPCSSRVPLTSHLDRLQRLVTIDEHGGTGLRDGITRADLLIFDTGTADDSAVQPPSASSDGGPRAEASEANLIQRTCPNGHLTIASVVRFCEEEDCGHEFTDEPVGPGT